MVEVCLELNYYDRAIEYAERSKTRNLVELVAMRNLYPKGDISEAVLNQLSRLRREISAEQRRLEIEQKSRTNQVSMLSEEGSPQRVTPQLTIPDRSHLNQLRQQLDELIDRDITPIDPSFSLTQKVNPIAFEEIKNLIDDQTAIIEWYITNDKILTFITTRHHDQPIVKQFPSEDLNKLVKRMEAYLKLYYRKKKWWRIQLPSRLSDFAQILHLEEIISCIPKEQYTKIVLIPHRFLHLLPLYALPLGDGTCLLDHYLDGLAYAPSCQLLQLVQNQQRPNFQNLFAIQNPTGDLTYTDLEVETIRSSFPSAQVLVKQAATKTALNAYQDLPSVHCGHFSCHGTFNIASPLESALLLANDERLTLGEIFEFNLNQCRLVTLSACETGLSDITSNSDEYISLPSGFLFSGSTSVVASQWTVSDLSTAFLMIRFYQNLDLGNSVAVALNRAQLWLRDVTKAKLLEWVTANIKNPSIRLNLRKRFHTMQDDDQPFREPFHWAAFCAIGK